MTNKGQQKMIRNHRARCFSKLAATKVKLEREGKTHTARYAKVMAKIDEYSGVNAARRAAEFFDFLGAAK